MRKRVSDSLDVIAGALGDAFVRGAWTVRAMVERAKPVFRGAPIDTAELRTLALAVRRKYPVAPVHRPGELRQFISERIVQRELRTLMTAPVGVSWTFSPVAMGPRRWPVPTIVSIEELADGFGVTVPQLRWLADERGLERSVESEALRNYKYTWIPKRHGRWRLIEAPKERLKRIQRIVLVDVLASVPTHPDAYGFVRGCSAVDAARVHVGREVVIRMDLEDFFTSIPRSRVAAIFRQIGYPEPMARLFAALTTNQVPPLEFGRRDLTSTHKAKLRSPHLPQGSPTSPMLANLVAYRLDCRLSGLARSFRLAYSRYADDVVFSGDRLSATRLTSLLGMVQAIIEDEGFVVHHRKTRAMPSNVRQRVNGIVVNDRTNIARSERDQLRATLHNCVRFGPLSQNREQRNDFGAYLLGRISWINSCNPEAGAKLRATFDQIRWA